MATLGHFHDLGKTALPESIIFKPAPLNAEERLIMKRHCEIGHRMAKSFQDLVPIANYVMQHHEWWNGLGYPLGLSGDVIPLQSRILSIIDAYDAMTSERPYRTAKSPEEAMIELRQCAGQQFDPVLVEIFLEWIQNGEC
jgi:HD-GYP domain-containing protein (c-di-GMP phosphodiesterase class II)